MLRRFDSALLDSTTVFPGNPELSVIVPTYNERENIPLLVHRLRTVLASVNWEVVFVDDDSPDGTAGAVRQIARSDRRVRLVHRVGRRGLSSACIEGMLSTASPFVAVMDADLQHDETILPAMLDKLDHEALDIVIATRNSAGGSMGGFSAPRVFLSHLGQWISAPICKAAISDPMSGFFLMRRTFFLEVMHRLSGNGFKILLDLLASSERPPRTGEVGYHFGKRKHGSSKLDCTVGLEYLAMVVEKLSGGAISSRFVTFGMIGAMGVLLHLAVLTALYQSQHSAIAAAQAIATAVAMVGNFSLNNLVTFRDRKLTGVRWLTGLLTFCAGCSLGAYANVVAAESLLKTGLPWYMAAFAGILVSMGWNYSISSLFTWHRPKKQRIAPHTACTESISLS